MKLRKLTKELVDVKREIKALNDNLKDLKAQQEDIEGLMIQEFTNSGLTSAKFAELGNPYIMKMEAPRIVDEEKFYPYLEKSKQAGLIKRTVNANTLKSWWKGLAEEDRPDEFKVGLTIFKKDKIGIRGAKI